MKKFFLLSIIFFSLSINAEENIFSKYNQSTSFGIQFGAVDQQNDLGFQTLMFHLSVYGVYADIGGWPRSHGSDVRVDKWDDESCFMFHLGYQIPISSWFKITPIAGYYNHKSGMTDGYHWKVTSNGISNSFKVQDQYSGFDYGVNAMFHIHLNKKTENSTGFDLQLGGTYTKNAWYAGIGLNINFHN